MRQNQIRRRADTARNHAQSRCWNRQGPRRLQAQVREEVARDEAASHGYEGVLTPLLKWRKIMAGIRMEDMGCRKWGCGAGASILT